jgi:hypothetical protein
MTQQTNKRVVRNAWAIAITVVLAAAGASAQEPASGTDADMVRARQKISMMEGVLERAVANGAENLFREVHAIMPTSDGPRLIGAPEVRGFPLEGYGVFFDVVVPDLYMPPAWSLRYMIDQNGMAASTALGELKGLVSSLSDPTQRQQMMIAINRLEMQVGPAQSVALPAAGRAAGPATVSSQAAPAPSAAPPSAAARANAAVLDDPNEGYTREVKQALIDAMLENSGGIPLAPDEWLMVAARGNVHPDLSVTDSSDTHTIVLRLKGSDLADFRANRITQDEARKRVAVREY